MKDAGVYSTGDYAVGNIDICFSQGRYPRDDHIGNEDEPSLRVQHAEVFLEEHVPGECTDYQTNKNTGN